MAKMKRYSIWNSNTGRVVGTFNARNEESAFTKFARSLDFASGADFAKLALGMTEQEAMRLYTFEVLDY
jgi:hypothetical protein